MLPNGYVLLGSFFCPKIVCKSLNLKKKLYSLTYGTRTIVLKNFTLGIKFYIGVTK